MANEKEKSDNQETDIEKEEVDTTAEKAKDIGEKLGIRKDEKEEGEKIPEYEVIEEDDKPIAKEREERSKPERKQLTNKEKRDLRKKRVQEKFQAKDAIIQQQQEQLQQLSNRVNEFEGRLSNVDRTKVDEMLNQAIASFNVAEKDHMEAFKEGDGEKATKAMRVMYEAQKRIDQLQPIKQQYEKMPAPQKEQVAAPDALVAKKAREWAAKKDWYKADGSDEDSEIAKAISGKLVNEGFDPKSDDFWDELDDRLEKRGIGKAEDEEDDEEEEIVPKRRAPPVSGGSKRGDSNGKVQVTLPTAYVQHLKDKGWWDDPKMKAKMIGRYLETQKSQNNS